MKDRPSLSPKYVALAILIVAPIVLGLFASTVWATPVQDPQRQTVPTRRPPTRTPTVTPTPTSTRCHDGMTFVEHVTYDDLMMTDPPEVQPGQTFVKTWRVRNSGMCPWDPTYSLVFVEGSRPGAEMGGKPVFVVGVIPTGAYYEFSVELVAPLEPGVYVAAWQLQHGPGALFGDRLFLAVEVVGASLAEAPTATSTPPPAVDAQATAVAAAKGTAAAQATAAAGEAAAARATATFTPTATATPLLGGLANLQIQTCWPIILLLLLLFGLVVVVLVLRWRQGSVGA